MMAMLKRLWKDEKGLETVEYAIIAGLIVIGAIVAIGAVGTAVEQRFVNLKTQMGTP